jgi:tRNA uridine 5-carbamoylmethylation protein Kti12
MSTCFILSGVSGCGKSTVAKKLVSQFTNEPTTIFSLDSCRLKFFEQEFKKEGSYAEAFKHAIDNGSEFDKFVTAEWKSSLKSKILIVDNTNLSRKSRARWCQEARQKQFSIWGISVYAPLSIVIDRQQTRGDKSVPVDIVRDMFMRQQGFMVGDEVDFMLAVDGTADVSTLHGKIHFD